MERHEARRAEHAGREPTTISGRSTTKSASAYNILIQDLHLTVKGGPPRRMRWDILRL
jgi:hypothetical protein